jgi:glycosyltransferase involved in cell wall biosynthesis
MKVLAICMFDSIHSARWLSQFRDQEIDFLLVPSSPHRRVHPKLMGLIDGESRASFRLVPLTKFLGLPMWILDKFLGNALRGAIVRSVIGSFKPDFVHALELQNAGYIALAAMRDKKSSAKLIATNWGSDIFWFQRFPKHRVKLESLLRLSDFYSAECARDVQLARELGFTGTAMPVIPNAGGFSAADLARNNPSSADRNVIAIKGYQGWVGRAVTAIEAVAGMKDELSGMRFVIYSANAKTIQRAKALGISHGIKFEIFGKGKLSHGQVLDLFAFAKIYVGLSESDGISTSLLEAMAMGAIPVQTATACCDEWFSDTGVAIREITVEKVQEGIRAALELAKDQSNADRNLETIRLKASAEKVSAIARGFYQV